MDDKSRVEGQGRSENLGSHAVIRHAYEGAVTASARVYSFSTGKAPSEGSVIAERQEMLALDDLIAFAIHARRLIENTIGPKQANETNVQALFEDRLRSVPITSIINCIVHNRHLQVVRSLESIYYASLVRGQKLHLSMRQEDLRKPLDPFCSVTSDKGRHYVFGIAQVIETFGPKILDPIIDLCAEKMLFLERFD